MSSPISQKDITFATTESIDATPIVILRQREFVDKNIGNCGKFVVDDVEYTISRYNSYTTSISVKYNSFSTVINNYWLTCISETDRENVINALMSKGNVCIHEGGNSSSSFTVKDGVFTISSTVSGSGGDSETTTTIPASVAYMYFNALKDWIEYSDKYDN